MDVEQELVNAPLSNSVSKLETVSDTNDVCFKNRILLKYNDESISVLPSLEEVDDSSTDGSDFSAGSANLFPNHECFELEFEEPRYNYHGPKIIVPRRECPVTICTADTIWAVKSR
jgi:hypothetical protein